MQLYETDLTIVASVMKALSKSFPSYALYLTADSDMLIVATQRASLPAESAAIFGPPGMRAELTRVGVESLDDLRERRLGQAGTLGPLFAATPIPANSDYFPFVDANAARLRFTQREASELVRLSVLPVPMIEMLASGDWAGAPIMASGKGTLERDDSVRTARQVRGAIVSGKLDGLSPVMARDVLLATLSEPCSDPHTLEVWRRAIRSVGSNTVAYLTPDESQPMWEKVKTSTCYRASAGSARTWADLLLALGARDSSAIMQSGLSLLAAQGPESLNAEELEFVLTATATAQIGSGPPAEARALLEAQWPRLSFSEAYRLPLIKLRALSESATRAAGSVAEKPGNIARQRRLITTLAF